MKNQKGFSSLIGIVIIIAVAVVAVGSIFAYQYFTIPKENNQQQNLTACTEEAKVCPDGSSVGRIGPNCEFATCPDQILSLVYSDDKKYTAFIETIEGPNLVTHKTHVKNQQTNEDKIIKTESCCTAGVGCGLCPLPCRVKNFSPDDKYVVIDCGTSPARTVNVINTNTKKEISFSSASNYFWSNNEEIIFYEPRESDDPPSPECKINVSSGVKSCGSQTAGWKTYTNDEYGFSFQYPSGAMKVLNEPIINHGWCNVGDEDDTCVTFASGMDFNISGLEIYRGININVISRGLDQKSIHKYDTLPLIGKEVDVTNKISIGGKNGYEYDIVSAVNYKINGFMVELDNSHFLEVYENSKYPILLSSDWKKIISTFKFTK